jgi:hypothetical protein
MLVQAEGGTFGVLDTHVELGTHADTRYRAQDNMASEQPGAASLSLRRRKTTSSAPSRAIRHRRAVGCRKSMSARERMDCKLPTTHGRAIYAQRSQTDEPGFWHTRAAGMPGGSIFVR